MTGRMKTRYNRSFVARVREVCQILWSKEDIPVQFSHVHFKSGSVLKTVLDKDVGTTVHKQEVICRMAI